MKKFIVSALLVTSVFAYGANPAPVEPFDRAVFGLIKQVGDASRTVVIKTLNLAYFVSCLCGFGRLAFPD